MSLSLEVGGSVEDGDPAGCWIGPEAHSVMEVQPNILQPLIQRMGACQSFQFPPENKMFLNETLLNYRHLHRKEM